MTDAAPAYDPAARRDTPLARKLKARIAAHGPMRIEDYMRACLLDPDHGFYRSANPLGKGGAFTTAPEISQTFGELIGLWCVAVWQQMGSPSRLNLIELGAGRGTMLADALRAAKLSPAFHKALRIHVAEPSATLRAEQDRLLSGAGYKINHLENDIYGIGEGTTILLANEVIDCLPIDQFIATPDIHPGWQHRHIGLDENGELTFTTGRIIPPPHAALPSELGALSNVLAGAREGDIAETRGIVDSELSNLKDFAFGVNWTRDFAALFIDYGHEHSGLGDTLQAVHDHKYEHPLCSPGEADLTAQVDFEQFARQMKDLGFAVDGPVPQAEFLGQLGILQRTSRLMAANPDKAADIEAGVMRLMAPTGMGTRFKAIGIRAGNVPALPGLQPLEPPQAKR